MKLYNFKRLIEKYNVACQLVTIPEGEWKAGVWQEGEPVITETRKTIIPISEKAIQNSGGSYKMGDCTIISKEPIDITSNTYLVHKDKKYKLEDSTDYSDYADFNTYVARRVSAFDSTGTDTTNNT